MAVGLAIVGFAAAALGNTFANQHGIAVFWPANGLIAGALVAASGRRVPLYLAGMAGSALAGLLLNPWPNAGVFVVCDALETGLWVPVILWLWDDDPWIPNDARPALWIVVAALVCPIPSSIVAAWWISSHHGLPALPVGSMWWIADFTGALVGFPAMIGWSRAWPERHARLDWKWLVEVTVLLAIATAGAAFVFRITSHPLFGSQFPAPRYLLFALLVWAALRFRPAVTATAMFAATVAAVSAITWRTSRPVPVETVLATQTFIAIAGFTSLLLALKNSARVRAEVRLQSSAAHLRALTERVQQAREEERARISRDIHDVVGQGLTAMKYALSVADAQARTDGYTSPWVAEIHALIDRNIEFVRQVAYDLRPSSLDQLGLPGAMSAQLEEFSRRTGVRCRSSIDAAGRRLDGDRALATFRAFQEALTNVARHAGATEVSVDAIEDDDELVVEVADNGVGLPIGAGTDVHHLGLLGMRERLMPFGGVVEFDRPPQGGTIVRVRLPLAATFEETTCRRAS